MVYGIYPDQKLISYELIAGGCANLNYKIRLEHSKNPLILRVYLRDKKVVDREQKIGSLLKQTLPVPLTYAIGEVEGYPFAVTEFMPGITLRDLLLGDVPYDLDLSSVMYDVGVTLSKIKAYEFPQAGFFDENLRIISPFSKDHLGHFAKELLESERISSALPSQTIAQIHRALERYNEAFFPKENERHLVHGDFDPANILVEQIEGVWKVSGVLDFEFAFSGSVLWDVATMLRYSHKMPLEFEEAFLKGLGDHGVMLPENWRITIKVLNLVSLLDCLQRSEPQKRPGQYQDLCELIVYISKVLATDEI